jgi:hypothetical protein
MLMRLDGREAKGYEESEAENMLRKLHQVGVLRCAVGKFSDVPMN